MADHKVEFQKIDEVTMGVVITTTMVTPRTYTLDSLIQQRAAMVANFEAYKVARLQELAEIDQLIAGADNLGMLTTEQFEKKQADEKKRITKEKQDAAGELPPVEQFDTKQKAEAANLAKAKKQAKEKQNEDTQK